MKGIESVFRMKKTLARISRELGLNYTCRVDVFEYEPGHSDIEGFVYPETFEIKIEAWSTHFYSLRLRDGRFVKYGAPLNTSKGWSAFRVARKIIRELKAHAAQIQGGAK